MESRRRASASVRAGADPGASAKKTMPGPGDRVVPHFREELEQCKARLLEMGGLAEEEVRLSTKGLEERDNAVLEHVMRGDGPLNLLHIEVDNRCCTLLALHQPMAADLRTIAAA